TKPTAPTAGNTPIRSISTGGRKPCVARHAAIPTEPGHRSVSTACKRGWENDLLRPASVSFTTKPRFPKFLPHCRILVNELRKPKGTSKLFGLVPLFDLKFLNEFAARDAGTSNRRH